MGVSAKSPWPSAHATGQVCSTATARSLGLAAAPHQTRALPGHPLLAADRATTGWRGGGRSGMTWWLGLCWMMEA